MYGLYYIFLLWNFVVPEKRTTFTCKFIPHLREGNRRTQAIEALRSLLFIGVPGTCDAYTLWYSYTANFEVLFNKQEIPITMTGISLLPFIVQMRRPSSHGHFHVTKVSIIFLSCPINTTLTSDLGSPCYNFLSFNRLDGVAKIVNPVLQFRFPGL